LAPSPFPLKSKFLLLSLSMDWRTFSIIEIDILHF
jgi:hypothetical protein